MSNVIQFTAWARDKRSLGDVESARRSLATPRPAASIGMVLAREIQADRRSRVLCVLSRAPRQTADEGTLIDALLPFGHAVSQDLMRTEMACLHELGLIHVETVNGLHVARLRKRGEAAA